MKESGNHGPASSAICPVSAKIPAPIMTPVPIETPPIKVMLFAWYSDFIVRFRLLY